MPTVILSAIPFDPAGWVKIDAIADDSLATLSRRVSRSATLDGGAAINDFGLSDSDRTFEVRWIAGDASDEAAVRWLIRMYALIRVVTEDGVFLAATESYRSAGAESILRLLVSSKESA